MTHDQLRPLNVPQHVTVELNKEGLPLTVASRSLSSASPGDKQPEDAPTGAASPVATILEIWRVDDEWWRHPISRRYVEVVLQNGRHVVLYEDLITGDWFMQRCD
jgi:hypothetical protein